MALQTIPLNYSSSTLCRSSSPLFQPQSHTALKFRVSCSNHQTQLDTKVTKKKTKKKNSPRPSFFHQIQPKWSLKLDSQREKFPWQEPEHEKEQQSQKQEDEEEREEESQNKPSAANFQFPKRFSPWPQAINPSTPQFDSESDASEDEGDNDNNGKGEPLQNNFGGSVSEERESESGKVNGERKMRRSNTELAEKLIPENELRRLRKIALRTMERFEVGVAGITQELVASVHQKWRNSEVVKFKFDIPLSANMARAHQILERLTGGTLLSRNKEYIVFYRGNDFLPPAVVNTLTERQKLSLLQQDEEEKARQVASSNTVSNGKSSQVPLFAGTLAETRAATTNWGHQPSKQEIESMRRDSALNKLSSLIKNHEKKLALAKAKFRKAEKAIAKVQRDLDPADIPTDLETLTDEERFLFRKIGTSMKPYFYLGRRDVYAGTIENMHLHWKYRELVKIIVRGRNLAQVKHIAISLEAESGGVLVSVDKDTRGHYTIIIYRGKNYFRPNVMRPKNLLTRRQALARSIELQRREALKHHILDLEERIELLKSELADMMNGKVIDGDKTLYSKLDNPVSYEDDLEENEWSEVYFDENESDDEDEKHQNNLLG